MSSLDQILKSLPHLTVARVAIAYGGSVTRGQTTPTYAWHLDVEWQVSSNLDCEQVPL